MARDSLHLTGVSETLLIPLFCRAWQSQVQDSLLHDPLAESMAAEILPYFRQSERRFHQDIVHHRWPKELEVMLAKRTLYFDDVALAFIEEHPDAQVIILACGLDSRFERLGYPEVDWFVLDLPDVMALRHQLLPKHPRIHEIPGSVLQSDWLGKLDPNRPTLIQAEGLLMYLPRQQIRYLFRLLADYFNNAEFVAEAVAYWLSKLMSEGPFKYALKHKMKLSGSTTYLGGLRHAREPESWHASIRLLGEYGYFDAWDAKMGLMNLLSVTPLRRLQWIVRYRLEQA